MGVADAVADVFGEEYQSVERMFETPSVADFAVNDFHHPTPRGGWNEQKQRGEKN